MLSSAEKDLNSNAAGWLENSESIWKLTICILVVQAKVVS